MKILTACIVVVTAGILALIVDCFWTTAYESDGIVIGKIYVPESDGIGSGVAGGKPVVVSTHTDEQWTVIVQTSNGVMSAHITPSDWVSVEKGSPVLVTQYIGKIYHLQMATEARAK